MKGSKLKMNPPGCRRPVPRSGSPTQQQPQPFVAKWPCVDSWLRNASPICFKLLTHWLLRADSRAAWIAGSNNATRMPMMAITTNSSTNVKPCRGREKRVCFSVVHVVVGPVRGSYCDVATPSLPITCILFSLIPLYPAAPDFDRRTIHWSHLRCSSGTHRKVPSAKGPVTYDSLQIHLRPSRKRTLHTYVGALRSTTSPDQHAPDNR